MAAIAASDITVTHLDKPRIYGPQRERLVRFNFGNSALTYPSGGVPMPSASTLGLRTLRSARVISDVSTPGTEWRWDYANNTLRAFRAGFIPPVVVSEAVTLTSHAGTLKYKPAYIICAVGTISATVQPLRPCPTGVTLAAKEFTVNWSTGAVACRAADSVTAMAVSYIPQQPDGPFSAANLVADEEIVLDTDTVNTASRAATMQYCYQTTATAARLTFGQAVASGVVTCDIQNSGATTFDCHADQDGKTAKVTYLKYAGFENNVGVAWEDQATIALTSEVKEWGKAAGNKVGGLMIPGLGGQLVLFRDTSVYEASYIGDATATAASTITKFDISAQVITTAETGDSESIQFVPFLFISPFYTPTRSVQELTVNDAPAATTLHLEVIG